MNAMVQDLSKLLVDAPVPTNFEWVVQPYEFDLEKSDLFFFWVNHGGETTFVSTYFNITDDGSSTSVSPPSPTSTASTANTASATSASSADDDASSPSSSDSSSSSSTAKVALGVGLGIGIPLMGILGLIAFMLYRRNQTRDAQPQQSKYWQMPHEMNAQPPAALQELSADTGRPELDANIRKPELGVNYKR